MKATTNPCTNCPDNRPLPKAMDFFDTQVVADYVTRRTACTKCPADAKPCLQPAPAKPLAQNEPKAAPTLAAFAAWLAASQQNELNAMSAATGDTFGKRCDRFIELTTVINAVREFQQVAAASAATTPTTSEAQAFAIERRTACTLCPTADKPCLKNEVAA